MRTSRLLVVAASTAALLVPALPASAAHEGNNFADLVGEGTGTATVNYVKGREDEEWTGRASVIGLDAGDYTFTVTSPNGQVTTTVCSFTATGTGAAGCSNSSFDVGGFLTAEIRDEAGDVVASGTFERRGNCREPEQAGTQCEAPGLAD